MSKFATSLKSGSSLIRTRTVAVVAGVGVSAALGAGVAAAATPGHAVTSAPSTVAESVKVQAAAQAKAAKATAAAQAKAAEAAKAKKSVTAKPVAAQKSTGWVKPLSSYALSASYAQAGGMWASKHSGQDFAVPTGTPVNSISGGTVVKAGPNGGGDGPAYGNAVVIKHNNGKYSQYAHLSKVNVQIGQKVSAGQQIALSGNTGNSSGPHLHFEIRNTANYGSAINPVTFLKGVGVSF
ncbi:M23 family metallopeptidase [Streptomyces sp. NPDC059578]|uniref:M23 family metallopeptidase n=1 Tax=unclassified Streptomyces TaxID=2593676 RepID=UPI00365EEB0D